MRSAGLSKEEILKIAKEKAQDIIDISIEEKEEFFELQLNTRCDFYPKHELRHAIHKINYGVDRNEKLEKTIADNMRKEIEDTVANFNIEFTDSLIVKLNLEDRYRQRYSDNNILYKVKRYYKEQGNVIYSRDLLLYYIEKFKSLIPSYEPLWRIIAYDVTLHENEEDMEEYMHSISERTRQLLFAYDTITDILRTGKTDNDIFFVFNFHLSHFISLVKSLGDNTGWLLNLYLKLKIDPYRIDLLDDYFRNRTSESHPRLAAYIYDNSQFLDFRKLNEYRDIVQHRHIIHSARVMVGKFDPKSEKIMIPKDPQTMVKGNVKVIERPESLSINFVLDNRSTEYLGDDEAVIYLGSDINNAYYEPLDFCKRQIDFISEMLSKIFEKIWEELSRELIGEVIDYFSNLGVMVTKLTGALKDEDMIVIEGATTYFSQKVESMEINKVKVQVCNNCDVGIKVKDRARPNDKVYRLIDKVPNDKGSSTIIKYF